MHVSWLRASVLFLLLAVPSSAERSNITFRTRTMGTWASLTVVAADSAAVAAVAYETLVVFHRVDSLMSNWTDDSEVARINREAGRHEIVVDEEVARVVAFAQQVASASGGAFDITVEPLVRLWGFLDGTPRVPSQAEIDACLERTGRDKIHFDAGSRTIRFAREDVRIDLGGIAKGYGVDAAAEVLRHTGEVNALIDLSGNMAAIGNAAGHKGWTVGIRDPSGDRPYIGRLRLYDQAVATSGDYEQFVDDEGRRYGHILDPRTGWSARGLSSVTIVAERAMTADAWATALFVLGSEEARRIATAREDLAVVLIEPHSDGPDTVWVERQLRSRFELLDAVAGDFTIQYF